MDVITKRKKIAIKEIDYPDEKNRNEQAVDMLVKHSSGEMVVEHTRIESFPGQIKDQSQVQKLLKPIVNELTHKLPCPGHYELVVDVGAVKGAKDTKDIQKALVKWIKTKAPLLQVGSPEVAPKHYITEKPDGVPFEVTLYRWQGNDGKFWIIENAPNDLMEKLRQRIGKALKEKCPKLCKAKGSNRTSVLVFELDDISLGNYIAVGKVLSEELATRKDAPDEIYLVRTEIEPWEVWVLKEGSVLFRDIDRVGPYYSDEKEVESTYAR
jgi:hypothetical protein